MASTSVTFGAFYGLRKAVCWTCNWNGPSHSVRRLAEKDAREHECLSQ